jgi:hypothetical protein
MAAWMSVYSYVNTGSLDPRASVPHLCELLGLGDLLVSVAAVIPLGLERRVRHGAESLESLGRLVS